MRSLALAVALACASATWAEGPGSRLRTTPEVPVPTAAPTSAPVPDQKRCDTLSDDRKARCLADARTAPDRRSSGPEATGMGSGAGSSVGSGTTGGATFGGSAPR